MAKATVQTPAPTGPRLPKRIVPLTLPAPYDAFHVTCWVNAPRSLWLAVTSTDEAAAVAALQQIVLDHDLRDFEGQPYAPASSPDFWQEIPTEVGVIITKAIQLAIGEIPKVIGAA